MRHIILIVLLILGGLSCNRKSPQQKVQAALENLLAKSPEDNRKFHAIPVPLTWKIGTLQGTTLAATTINRGNASITFDWVEIVKNREQLEPVIAHELDHAYDAYVAFGVEEFISQVEADKELPWKDRTVEKSALAQENATRKYLLANYPSEFKGMLPERNVK